MKKRMTEQNDLDLTRVQLEEIITEIAKKTIKQEIIKTKDNQSQALAETFGTWEDEKSDEEITQEIYDSRNSNLTLT